MADPLFHQMKGERLDVSAERINAWTDAARDYRRRKFSGGAGELFDKLTPSLEVKIRNDTGANLSAGSVLRVTGWLVSPVAYPFDVRARPVLSGDTPNATTNLIVILSESIPNGQLGSAVIPGPVAVCDILVNDAAHMYANPISGDNTRLSSSTSGIARIAAWESSGGVRRAIVVLGDGQSGGFTARKNSTGSTFGPRARLNLIEGAGVTLTVVDDAANDEIDVTITAAAAAFSGARVYRTTAQTAIGASDTLTAVAFTAEEFDTDAYHDNATNNSRLTVNAAVYHEIGCNIALSNTDITTKTFSVEITLNGTTNICHWQIKDDGTGATHHANLKTIWKCAASTDYFEVRVATTDATGVDVIALTSSEPVFWIRKIG